MRKSSLLSTPGLIILCFSALSELQSQCNTPDQLPTVQCVDAPLTCLQNACFATSTVSDQGWNGFCGPNTAVHNPQYFEIIPTEDCIQLNIHVDGCSSGAQLQAALVSSCNWQPCPGSAVPCADVLDCDPGTPIGGTMVIDACGLTPGVSLWLLVDGSSASLCQYTIEFATGIFQPPIEEEILSAQAVPGVVCQGYENLFMQVDTPVTNAHGYLWQLGWNGDTVSSSLPEIEIDIPQNAPAGIWDVCVSAFSGCDTTETPFCFPVEIIETVINSEVSLCCGEVVCGLCTDLEITLTGEGPWGVVISDGTSLDTIIGIESSPYLHQVCSDFPAFVEYSIVDILAPSDPCSTAIVEGTVAIRFFEPTIQDPWFIPVDSNMLCALPDHLGYTWYACGDTTVIGTTECIDVEADGCYCVEILFVDSCAFTMCSDILLSTDNPIASGITILPNPSNGKINIDIPEVMALPVKWTLLDHLGRKIRNGLITKKDTELSFSEEVNSGLFFIVLQNVDYRDVRKIVFTQ